MSKEELLSCWEKVQKLGPWGSEVHVRDPDVWGRILYAARKVEVKESLDPAAPFYPIVKAIYACLKRVLTENVDPEILCSQTIEEGKAETVVSLGKVAETMRQI